MPKLGNVVLSLFVIWVQTVERISKWNQPISTYPYRPTKWHMVLKFGTLITSRRHNIENRLNGSILKRLPCFLGSIGRVEIGQYHLLIRQTLKRVYRLNQNVG